MNDMETKQIINWLRDKADRADNPSWTRMMHKAADRLKELDQAQKWIPVAERLPEHKEYVLLCSSKGSILKGYYDHEWGCWSGFKSVIITHWMPLPKPPKEVNGND